MTDNFLIAKKIIKGFDKEKEKGSYFLCFASGRKFLIHRRLLTLIRKKKLNINQTINVLNANKELIVSLQDN